MLGNCSYSRSATNRGVRTMKIDLDTTKGKTSKAYCANCSRDTNQVVIRSAETLAHTDDDSIYWSDTYEIIQRQGCDTLSFGHKNRCSENRFDYEDHWDDGITEYLYPKRDDHTIMCREFGYVPWSVRCCTEKQLIATTTIA